MELPPLHLLRTFEAAARCKSFTAAARELGITQSAVSQQIRQLETWIGRKLFQRDGRSLRLSHAGLTYHNAITDGLSLIESAGHRLRGDDPAAGLTVACTPAIMQRWLMPALPDHLRQFPQHPVRVTHANPHQSFAEDEADILITLTADIPTGLAAHTLFHSRRRPVAGALLLRQHPELLTPEGLAKAPLVHDSTTNCWADWFTRAGIAHTAPRQGPVFTDFHLLCNAVLAGNGVALCPVDVFRKEIDRGELVVLSPLETSTNENFMLIHDAAPRAAVAAFADWFTALCTTKA